MVARFERFQGILGRRIRAAKIPHIRDTQKLGCTQSLHYADVTHGRSLFRPRVVGASIAEGRPHQRYMLSFVDQTCNVGRRHDFIVGVSHDHQHIGFIAFVWLTVVSQV